MPALRLVPFEPRFAGLVASWAPTAREVRDWCHRATAPVPASEVSAWSDGPDVEAWLLLEDDRPVAYGELWPEPAEGEVELARLVVDPRRRGRGVGRRLAADLAARAAADHPALDVVVLRVHPGNVAAERAYAAAGFRPVPAAEAAVWNRGQSVAWSWMRFG